MMVAPIALLLGISGASAAGGAVAEYFLSSKKSQAETQPSITQTYHAPYERYEPTQIYAPTVSTQRTYTTIIGSPKARVTPTLEADLTSRPSIETTKKEAPQTQTIAAPSTSPEITRLILPLAILGGGIYILGKVID